MEGIGMVFIGHRSSKSTFGPNKCIIMIMVRMIIMIAANNCDDPWRCKCPDVHYWGITSAQSLNNLWLALPLSIQATRQLECIEGVSCSEILDS